MRAASLHSLCPGRDAPVRLAGLIALRVAGLVLAVLFLVSDDMRPSIGGHYALPEAHTPNLERLMDEGITFARAYIQYSYCSPSRNS